LAPALAQSETEYRVVRVVPSFTFDKPVGLYHAGDGSNRLFVVEKRGLIHVFTLDNPDRAEVLLDVRDRVNAEGYEEGLLGLAFSTTFTFDGVFYLYYSANPPRRSVVAQYTLNASDPRRGDPASEQVLFEVLQPYSNHNGGQIAFGPEGSLYVALGDGGSGGDPLGYGQNRSTLLGAILRVEVEGTGGNVSIDIPVDNPFVGNTDGYREEIYAYGFRNPWRFSFDPLMGTLWVADVGQNRIEEIDVVEKGGNYGWNTMEGSLCYEPSEGCNTTGLRLPLWEYDHTLGNSVTGGFVYRGGELPELNGSYIFGDYGSGRIWALRDDTGGGVNVTELFNTALNIASFGVDEDHELYICAYDGGIYRLTRTVPPRSSEYVVEVDGVAYRFSVRSNSSVTDVAFRQQEKTLGFNVIGTTGTAGFSNVTFPQQLLGGTFMVLVDGVSIPYVESSNATHRSLFLEYTHSKHLVEIVGTTVIPEINTPLIMGLVLLILTVATRVVKRSR
jgi:glucose/arabinose dehydrogenase